jgi:predicted transcriptional regulator
LLTSLTGLVVADAVTINSPVVLSEASLRDFVDLRTLSSGNWRKFLVTDAVGKLVGEITVDALQGIPGDLWSSKRVAALMQPIDSTTLIESGSSLLAAIEQLEKYKLPALTVVQPNGSLVGLLEKTVIIDLMQKKPEILTA